MTTNTALLPADVAASPHVLPDPIISALHHLRDEQPDRITGWIDGGRALNEALSLAQMARPGTLSRNREPVSLAIGAWEALSGQLWTARQAMCACCAPRRDMVQPTPGAEWQHVDDEHAAEHRHIHIDGASSDCDGPHSHGHLRWPFEVDYTGSSFQTNDAAQVRNASFDTLWANAVRGLAPTYGEFTIRGVEGRVTMDRATDEGGGESIEVRVCDDPWCSDGEWQRDVFAEMAGY